MNMKNVLVISSSLRRGSNSEALAKEFARGASDSGNKVELISLRDKAISFCRGCLACQKTQKCVIADDAQSIVAKMQDADVIAFATPIYYYEMSGQLKTLLDRAVMGLTGWIDCFEKARLARTVFAGGVNEPDEITGHQSLAEAYAVGNKIR